MQDGDRQKLLFPPWAGNGNGVRFDGLAEADQKVWRATRNQRTDADSESAWVDALVNAIRNGVITREEAEQAIKRVADGT